MFITDIFNRFNNYARSAVYNWLFPNTGPKTNDEVEEGIQNIVSLARRYYDGDHTIYMTKRQRAWLDEHGGKVRFTVNHCPTVVDSVVERLEVTGFNVPDNEAISKLFWSWWQANRMDTTQIEAHRGAVKDGEGFILVSWDEENWRPKFTLHPRFVDVRDNLGDGYGMWIEYPNNDYLLDPIKAVKQWRETVDRRVITRRTEYYPDKIRRLWWDAGEWRPFEEEGKPSEESWIGKNGKPLGIPVAHLRNPGLKSELFDVIPLQDMLNKVWLDIAAAGDMTGFQMLAFFGWIPTTDGEEPKEDGSNLVQVAPGQMIGTTKPPGEASVEIIPPASSQSLLDDEERIVVRIASITDTPLSRFLITHQVAAEGTLKQQEGPLIAKVKERQKLYGNSWEDVMRMALKLAWNFDNGVDPASIAEISTIWADPETRDETVEIDNGAKKKTLGVPVEQIFQELHYTREQIEEFKKSPEWKARLANLNVARVTAEDMNNGG